MSDNVETSVVQVGFRDFLFYVVPGATILLGLLGFEGVTYADLPKELDLVLSTLALFAAYLLGQCAYALSYPVRAVINRLEGSQSDDEEPAFRQEYRAIARTDPVFFAVEVFRYRTLARFCAVMVVPVLLAAVGVLVGRWPLSGGDRWLVAALATIAEVGFVVRYRRYWRRYRSACSPRGR
jgi:hypothetical protein